MSSKPRRRSERRLRRRLARLRKREVVFMWESDTRFERVQDGVRKWGYEIDEDDEDDWVPLGTYYFIWVEQALRPYSFDEAQRLVDRLEDEHAYA